MEQNLTLETKSALEKAVAMKRRLIFLVGIFAASLLGVGSALAVQAQREGEPPPSLTAADCLSGQISSGDVTHMAPGDQAEVETASPEELASRYVEDTNFRETYPDVKIVSTFSNETQEVIALASGDLIVGQLEYTKTSTGWQVQNVSACYKANKE